MMLDELSQHAFDARLAQLTGQGYVEYVFDGEVRGAGWTAFFEIEEDPYGGIDSRHEVCPCTVATLKGAWMEDDDGRLFCGNADEVTEIVGAEEVARWVRHVEEGEDSK